MNRHVDHLQSRRAVVEAYREAGTRREDSERQRERRARAAAGDGEQSSIRTEIFPFKFCDFVEDDKLLRSSCD
jgi:hypothetical protein